MTMEHSFSQQAHLSYRQVFEFAFQSFAEFMHLLEEELKTEAFGPAQEVAAARFGRAYGQKMASRKPSNDLAAFTAWTREPSPFMQHVLSWDVVEDTEHAVEVRVRECLWSEVFRAMGAADVGFVFVCQPDFTMCQGFNPQIRLERTRTLMQGHDCCDHRWVWQDQASRHAEASDPSPDCVVRGTT